MAAPKPEELVVLERQRQAILAGDREAWFATVDPALVAELLPDWPGPNHLESAAAVWDLYRDFMAQFERATYDYGNVEVQGKFTVTDIKFELVGLGSGTPVEVSWTVVGDFDLEARRYKTNRWFHARDEALAWISGLEAPVARGRD